MSEHNIAIPVDLTNPGQFFACCGLLELASRIDRDALGWFDGSKYCMSTSAKDVLDKFFGCAVEVDTSYQSADADADADDGDEEGVEDDGDRHRGRIFPMTLGPPFNLLLNWWTDDEAQGQKLKLWTAGQRVTAGVTADKGDVRLSEVGMDGAPSTFQLGGIEAMGGICREASLNLCTLRDIESTSDGETRKLQRYILGLSLVAITYLDGKVLNLRQGCQLVGVPGKPMERLAINADGTGAEFAIDAKSALKYAGKAAADFGIGPDRVDIVFDAKAAKAARKKAKAVKTEDNA